MGVSGEAMGVREVSAEYGLQTAKPGVPVGYKQTEVGVIPEDWAVLNVGEAFDICNNLRLPISAKVRREMAGEYPYYGPTKIQDYLAEYRVDGEFALIGEDGDHFLDYEYKPQTQYVIGKFNVNNHAHLVRGKIGLAQWFYLYFRNRDISTYLTRQGAGRYKLNKAALVSIPCAIPSELEQRAIATALSDMDTLLDGLDQLITKKRDLKQAAMQQLLTGQTRLPGFEGKWEVKRLGELAEMGSGGTPLSSVTAYYDGSIPWVSISDMTNGGKIIDNTERNLTELGFSNSAAQMFPSGTVLYAMYASLGECSIAGASLCTSQAILGIRAKSNLHAEFLYYYLTSLKSIIKTLGQQGTQSNLNKSMVQNFRLNLPPVTEQTAIATVLSDMDSEIESLEQRRHKTRDLKQAMTQELLTGRTRLIKPLDTHSLEDKTESREKKANVHFMRSVLAAEIIDQLHEEPTFGHVKFEKMLFLVEHLCEVDTGSTYHRQAAGPYDNKALRSIDSQLRKQQWFDARKESGRYRYVPLHKQGGHKTYFDRYFSGISANLIKILATLRTLDTEKCEIVATLFSAWNDLLCEKTTVSDDMIVHEVLHNWHESKKRISEDRWRNALGWMREKGFVPKRFASA